MELKALPAEKGNYNLKDYDETYRTFDWKDAEKHFSWHKTGKINAAYEAIDRHAESNLKNKVAFYYKDPVREEKYTFREMKNETNKAGNVLKQHADVGKGDRVFVFMPRSPELYFILLGAIKLGAIV
ncbi:AMP-binding protein, partial [Bacillus licheniformis]